MSGHWPEWRKIETEGWMVDEGMPLEEFVGAVLKMRDDVPEEHRGAAKLYVGGETNDAYLYAYWMRPETEDERAARIAEAEYDQMRAIEYARAEHARLTRLLANLDAKDAT